MYHGLQITIKIKLTDHPVNVLFFTGSNEFCGLKINGTQMTQIDMIDMI